jgi:hypothetical protein
MRYRLCYLLIINYGRSAQMAQKIQTLFVDDIDGSEAGSTARFALDGTDYEIDLSTTHSEALHDALEPFIAHARKIGGTRRSARGSGRRGAGNSIDTTAVRTWARKQGIDIKDRGRVPADVVAKYREAAH